MATVRDQGKPAASAKYDAFVAAQLDRARRRIRLLDVSAGLLLFLSGTLLYALVVGLLDRKLELSALTRQVAFTGYAVAALALLAAAVVRPLVRRINPYFAARALERTLAGSKNSLVNWLDLHDEELPAAIHGSLARRAADSLKKADLEQAISGRRAVGLAAVAAALLLGAFVLFVSVGLAGFGNLLARAFAPFGGGPPMKRTQIAVVRPVNGDAVVGVGQPVNVAVSVTGRVPDPDRPDALKLQFRYRDGDPYEEQPLEADSGDVWMTVVPPSRTFNGFWYKVTGGDAETPEHHVTVHGTPLVERFDVTYHHRQYTGWPDAHSPDADLKGLRGTEAELLVHTNRPVKEGRAEVETRAGKKSVPAELVPGDPQAMRLRLVLDQDGQYRVWFTAADGDSSVAATTYPITARPDAPPKVTLTKPAADVTLPANGTLRLEGKADDDVGVKEMALRLRLAGGAALQPKPYREGKDFLLPDGGYPKELGYLDFVALDQVQDEQGKPFALAKGMVLEYWLEAADACDYPAPNPRGESKHYRVTIADPTPDRAAQEKERDRAAAERKKHDRQQDDKLKEENEKNKQDQADKAKGGDNPEKAGEPDQPKTPKDPKLEDAVKKAEQATQEQQRKEEREGDKSASKGAGDGKGEGKGDNQPQQQSQEKGDAKPEGAKGDGKKEGSPKGQGAPEDGKQPEGGQGKPDGAQKPDSDKGGGKGDGHGEQQGAASAKPDKPEKGDGKGEGRGEASRGAAAPKDHGAGKPDDNSKGEGAGKGAGQETGNPQQDAKAGAKGDQPSLARGTPKPGDAAGEPKGGPKPEGNADGGKAASKSAGGDAATGAAAAKGDPTNPKRSELAKHEGDVRQGTPEQSAEAQKWLDRLAKSAKDAELRDLAKTILEDAGKDRASSPALPKGPPAGKGGPPCECKGGNGKDGGSAKAAAGKDSGEGKPGQGPATAGDGKTGGSGREGGKVSIADGLGGRFTPPPAPEIGRAGDPAHRARAGNLQLRDYRDIDPTILKDLNISPEEWAAAKAYAERRSREEAAEKLPGSQGSKLPGGGGEVKVDKTGAGGAEKTGLGDAPPELRNLYRQYTKGQAEKK